MKRKLAVFLSVLLLLCAVLPSAAGAGTMYSMSANDKLLEYSADTMPVVYDGMIYVPYTLFVSRQNGGIEFGVFHSWNKKVNVLSLYSKDKPLLSFDIGAGTAYDVQDNVYPYKAILRNGMVFVPAQKVCNYFGLQYSAVSHAYGTLVRVKQEGNYYLSDAFLISAADQRLKDQKDSYDRDQKPVIPPTPSVEPTPPPPAPEEPDRADVYFAFRCETGENADRIRNALERYGARGAFYFHPEVLAQQDDLIRCLVAGGHKVGLLIDSEDPEACNALAAEGNRLLKHIAWTHTDFLMAEAEEIRKSLEEQGWVCWQGNVNGIPKENQSAATVAANARRSIENRQRLAKVTMDDSNISAAALEQLLPRLVSDRYAIKALTETIE